MKYHLAITAPNFIMVFELINFTKWHLNVWLSKMSSNYIAVTQGICTTELQVHTFSTTAHLPELQTKQLLGLPGLCHI